MNVERQELEKKAIQARDERDQLRPKLTNLFSGGLKRREKKDRKNKSEWICG